MYINFGVPQHYSGKIKVMFCEDNPKESMQTLPLNTTSKKNELEILKEAPVTHYTYS